jgi:hypothetical protein
MGLISKKHTFSSGAVIVAAEHNDNFDDLFSAINGSLDDSNIDASAAILATKLNLSTIAQSITFTGTLDFSSATITAATTFANLTATSFTGTTVDINGGNIDGTIIGASSAVGGTFSTVLSTALQLTETTAPTTAASKGAIYTKDSGTQPELFFREESSGDEVQITSNGATIYKTNTLFQYSGVGSACEIMDSNIVVSTWTPLCRYLIGTTATTGLYETVWETKWMKIASVSYVTVYGQIWQTYPDRSGTVNLKVDIGGVSNNANGTQNRVTPEWKNFDVDVSTLTNGTVYDVRVQLKITAGGGGSEARCSNVIAFGKL